MPDPAECLRDVAQHLGVGLLTFAVYSGFALRTHRDRFDQQAEALAQVLQRRIVGDLRDACKMLDDAVMAINGNHGYVDHEAYEMCGEKSVGYKLFSTISLPYLFYATQIDRDGGGQPAVLPRPANPRRASSIESADRRLGALIDRGIVTVSPAPRVVDPAFGELVLRAARYEPIEAWEAEASPNVIASLQMPIGLAVLTVGLFLGFARGDFSALVTALFGGVASLSPLLTKLGGRLTGIQLGASPGDASRDVA